VLLPCGSLWQSGGALTLFSGCSFKFFAFGGNSRMVFVSDGGRSGPWRRERG
jgi:hypothetical protein